MSEKILKLPDVMAITGLSRSSIYALIQNDAFPIQINLGERSVGWLETEIDIWIQQKVKQRRVK